MKYRMSMVFAIIALMSSTIVTQADESASSDKQSAAPRAPIDTETYRNQVVKAYVKALKEKKYTLVLFSKSHNVNPFAKRMVEKLKNPVLAKYSDRVVMCLCDPELDSSSSELHQELNVKAYPALFLIKTNREKVDVKATVIGEVETTTLNEVLTNVLRQPIDDVGQYAEDLPETKQNATSSSTVSSDSDETTSGAGTRTFDLNRFRNRLLDAYMTALHENKYTVVLLKNESNGFADRMERKLKDPKLGRFVDQCIVTVSRPSHDSGAKQVADELNLKAYPHLLVVNTNRDQFPVVGEIIGEVDVDQIVDIFERSMTDPAKQTAKAEQAEQDLAKTPILQEPIFEGTPGFAEMERMLKESNKVWAEINQEVKP
ncbi:MAG: hypothetical protein KDB27_03085 [Planctomycetales bacterium]|nr:hypothetical protein [Planctomycetales bacterium]